MKKINKNWNYFLVSSAVIIMSLVLITGYQNKAFGFLYGSYFGLTPSSFDKDIVVSKISNEISKINTRLSNNIISNLNYIPVNLRSKVLAADESIRNNLNYLKSDISTKSSDQEIYNIVSEYESQRNLEYFSRVQRQNVLLLKNYNRLYRVVQDSYIIINDAIYFIENNNPNTSANQYFSTTEYNNQVLTLKSNLENLKNNDLNSLESNLDSKMNALESKSFGGTAGINRSDLKSLENEVLSSINNNFLSHKSDYENIRSSISSNISDLLNIAGVGSISLNN
jgi:hypothetical protein